MLFPVPQTYVGDIFKFGQYGIMPPLLMSSFNTLPATYHSSVPPANKLHRPNSPRMFSNVTFPNLFRLLEFVQVPSRFAGTDTYLSANTPTGAYGFNAVATGSVPAQHHLHPPYNRVSRYRDPGKVNINTISDPTILAGILNGGPTAPVGASTTTIVQNYWYKLVKSRRGFR